jgi:hypothetical protein
MTVTRKKHLRDPLQLGRIIVEIATRQVEHWEDDGKDAAAPKPGKRRPYKNRGGSSDAASW